jgi:hypothetical protein
MHRGRVGDATSASFGYYYAVRGHLITGWGWGRGFTVFGANGQAVPCGGGLDWACEVSSIDLTPMNIMASDVSQVLSDVGYGTSSVRLLFAGTVQSGALEVYETWRAPDLVSTRAQLREVHASCNLDAEVCTGVSAVDLNVWTSESFSGLDFSNAPAAAQCFLDTKDGACTNPSLDAPLAQTGFPAGTIVAGKVDGGVLDVTSYFLLVSTGHVQSNDGWSYCGADQHVCNTNQCSSDDSCYGTHGRGRGLIEVGEPNTTPMFQTWLTTTNQLGH